MTSIDDLRQGCAVITGAGSGIGAALALRAAVSVGMRVAVLDVSLSRAEETALRIGEAGGVATPFALDVADSGSVLSATDEVEHKLGAVTLLAANAGIEHSGEMWAIPPDQWKRVQDVNVNGMFNTIRGFLPSMINARGRRHVLCVGSIGSLTLRPSMSAYIVSKHAALAIGLSLAVDVKHSGHDVGVSVLLPGPAATRIAIDGTAAPSDEAELKRNQLADLLENQGLKPDEIAKIAFLGIEADRPVIYTHPELAARTVVEQISFLQSSLLP